MNSKNFRIGFIYFYLLFGIVSQAHARCDVQFPSSFCEGPVFSNGEPSCRDIGPADGTYSCILGSQREFCSCFNNRVGIKLFDATPSIRYRARNTFK